MSPTAIRSPEACTEEMNGAQLDHFSNRSYRSQATAGSTAPATAS